MKTNRNSLIKELKDLQSKVNDGCQYFGDFRLEELKTDDVYYIEIFVKYINILEKLFNSTEEYVNGRITKEFLEVKEQGDRVKSYGFAVMSKIKDLETTKH